MTTSDGPAAAADSDLVAAALADAVSRAQWPDGSLLVDLHPDVLRERLAPHLTAALTRQQTEIQP